MRVEESIVINAPPEAVFEHVSTPEKSQQWDESLIEIEMLTDAPFGLGTRVREVRKVPGGKSESVEEVTTFEPGRKMGWTTVEGSFKSQGLISVEPHASGSHVNFSLNGKGNIFVTLLSPIISKSTSKEIRHNLHTLKNLVETPQTAG